MDDGKIQLLRIP